MNPLLAAEALHTRRQFFGRSVLGVGTAALASLLGRDAFAASPPSPSSRSPRRPRSARSPSLRPESETRHLSFPERRALSRRPFRLQTEAPRMARQADPRRSRRRQTLLHHDRQPDRAPRAR